MQKAEGRGAYRLNSHPASLVYSGDSLLNSQTSLSWQTGSLSHDTQEDNVDPEFAYMVFVCIATLHTENTVVPFLAWSLSNSRHTISNEQDNFAGLETGTWTPEEGRGATRLLQADLSCWGKWEKVGLSQASLPSAEQLLPARHSTKAAKGETEDRTSPQITRDVFTAMWSQRVQEELWTFGVYESHFYLLNVYTLVQEELWTFGVCESWFYLLNVYTLMNLLIIFV